jgi:hypothetical protein
MVLSDRELKSVIGFYMGLRKAVFIAGCAAMVAGVAAVIALTYNIGRENGGQAAASGSPSGQAQTAPNPKPRRIARRHVKAPPPEREEVEQAGNEATPPDVPAVTEVDIQAAPPARVASAPGVDGWSVAAPSVDAEPVFSVTLRPKRHAWPRRFFGAIGRGFGKAFGAR